MHQLFAPTPIYIERGITCSPLFFATLKRTKREYVLLTDEQVQKLWVNDLKRVWEQALGCSLLLLTFPAGENSKSRETKQRLENQLLQRGLGRDLCLIAVGGGVVLDLVGFLAATYQRSTPVIYIPTTLLAMVDGVIGGKNGVNTPWSKNGIGTFAYPESSWIDERFLSTLAYRELLCGWMECAKKGLVADSSLFLALEENPCNFESLIIHACSLKAKITEKDPRDHGLRQILNFGHTIGHALERAWYYRIPHGIAVGWGILGEAVLSLCWNSLPLGQWERILRLFSRWDFFSHSPLLPEGREFSSALFGDKKRRGRHICTVLLEQIGKALEKEGAYSFSFPLIAYQKSFSFLLYLQERWLSHLS